MYTLVRSQSHLLSLRHVLTHTLDKQYTHPHIHTQSVSLSLSLPPLPLLTQCTYSLTFSLSLSLSLSLSHTHTHTHIIGVHEMHGRMHPNYCQITILLVVNLCSSLAYFLMIQPLASHSWQIAYKNFGCYVTTNKTCCKLKYLQYCYPCKHYFFKYTLTLECPLCHSTKLYLHQWSPP